MSPDSLTRRYQSLIEAGTLRPDPAQDKVIAALEQLRGTLANCSPRTHTQPRKRKFLPRLLRNKQSEQTQGIYLWGGVGRGKSLLMDLFYASVTDVPRQRIHFHAFMRDVHARLHAWRQLKPDGDLLPRVVQEMAGRTRLLCLDELQVHDVTDAMILARLFTLLFERGVVVVFTSNRPPDQLYRGGLQREQFEQFIALVKARMEIIELKGPQDYRLAQLQSVEQTYIHPLGPDSELALYEIYRALTQDYESQPVRLPVQGRVIDIEKTACGVAWLTFGELCERPLGAADYLELARQFHTLILQDIPSLGAEKRNEAKRFVTLIDALYDHKVKFVCSAAVPPAALYPAGDGAFEFERTVSRLIEMQSTAYLALPHHLIPSSPGSA